MFRPGTNAETAVRVVIVLNYADLTAAAAVLPVVFIFHVTIRSWVGRFEDAQEHTVCSRPRWRSPARWACDVVSEDLGPHSCLSTALCDGEALTGVLTVYRDSGKPFTLAAAR